MSSGDDNLRDPRVDAAWRAASREEPPRALDDAILAAARREVGAGPQRAAGRKSIPEALSPERWWWPLAAAATIGAIAIGILQLAGPDRWVEPAADKAVVSDVPSGSVPSKPAGAGTRDDRAPTREPAAKPAAPVVVAAPPPVAATAPAPLASQRKDAPARAPREERAGTDAAATAPSPAQPPPMPRVETVPVAPPPVASAESARSAPPLAEPFPAEASRRDAPTARAAAPAPAAPVAGAATGLASSKLAASPPLPASAPARRMQEADGRGARADSLAGSGDATADGNAKAAPKLPVAEWIALIRRLRDEGRTDEAAKELAAFRDAYADHGRLLPPDLRDWKPAAR